MAKKKAVLVVSKEWVNSGVNVLVNRGRASRSTTAGHLLIAWLAGVDAHGVWLENVSTGELTEDGSDVSLRVLVPWNFVLCMGELEDEEKKVPMGYIEQSPGKK